MEFALRSAMNARRELENEMAAIDGKIREAILAADAATMTTLQARKRELPMAYIKASHAERQLADRIHGQARADAERAFAEARAHHEAQASSLWDLEERHRRELREAEQALVQAENQKNTAQTAFLAANERLTGSQEGCKRALGRVAEKF